MSYYIAELFAILWHHWGLPCPKKLLSYTQFQRMADVYTVLLNFCDDPNRGVLLTFNLSYYISESFLVL